MKTAFKTAYRLLVNLQEELADADAKLAASRKAYEAAAKNLKNATKRGQYDHLLWALCAVTWILVCGDVH